MKADQIIKNAKIFTADKDKMMASALAVKDGTPPGLSSSTVWSWTRRRSRTRFPV